jgi:hypothetical protein
MTTIPPMKSIKEEIDSHAATHLRYVYFLSCYIYSPRGSSYSSESSRQVCVRLKAGNPVWLPIYAGRVRELSARQQALAELFAGGAVLVPAPRSIPGSKGVWAAHQLALALHGVGLSTGVWAGVKRRFAVAKSSTALNGARPTVHQHLDSLAIDRVPCAFTRIVIVDDVITKGRTILATAMCLHQAFPHADIRAFALVRTMGFVPDVSHSLELCQGVVRWAGGDARRDP